MRPVTILVALTVAGCGAGGVTSDGGMDTNEARADRGAPDAVEAMDVSRDTAPETPARDTAPEAPLCRTLFAACVTDMDCCAPNRCLVITGTPQCQLEGPADAGVACGTLQNTSPAIKPSLIASLPSTFAGGPLVDGTYELFAAEETLTTNPAATYQRTFRLSAQGTAFEWVIHDVGSAPPDHHFLGTITASGGALDMAETCVGTSLHYPYDAQAGALTLYFIFGANGRAFHYRAR